MLMKAEQSTLLLIDVQEKLMPAISHGEEVVDRCITLATIAGLMEVPVLATEQLPDKLGHNVEAVRELSHQTLAKHHFDACPDGLVDHLPEGRQHIVVGGCETHVCMMQTALSLVDAGYKVWVVADATGSRNEFDRDVALDRLSESGARVVTLEMVAFEWMRHCRHPQFRNIQALIK
ncbi:MULTISPECIES: isochorismatase family protein [Marinobacter]|uniref:Isochorismatase family protein n=1 Tax=Marinobacter metalliresistant TaxID=2961995 RepID=A0ABZ2W3I8_9GAMM|nr:isochorismatase family protein [Marinobacter sp. Arc7-DN-1]AXS81776.1 isochorismatase family protein [Marinobacter sp. Arc7-DN-1]